MSRPISSLLRKMHPRELLRTARYALFDLRYGGFCGGCEKNPTPGAYATGATDYALMPQIFNGRIGRADVLCDVGCGKGRVINWWLARGCTNRIFGLELLQEVARAAQKRLARFPNVTILAGDALAHLPEEATLFYLANPFDERFLKPLAERLLKIAEKHPVRVIYFAPVFLGVFANPAWEVEVIPLSMPAAGFFEDRHRRFAVISPAAPFRS